MLDAPVHLQLQADLSSSLSPPASVQAASVPKQAGTGYIESTLVRGSMLLKDLGVSEDAVSELVKELHQNDYALIRASDAEVQKS